MIGLKQLRNKFVKLKFYMDLGTSFMVLLNFLLLSITASDKLMVIFHLDNTAHGTYWVVLILFPLAIIGTICFGFFMDKIVKYYSEMRRITTTRDPIVMETLERVKNIEAKLK